MPPPLTLFAKYKESYSLGIGADFPQSRERGCKDFSQRAEN